MSSVLESLSALVRRQKTKAEGYPEVVRAYADGKPIDVEQTEATLTAAGKTAEDLQTDVKAILRRRQLAEVAAKQPAIAKRQNELRERLAREKADWDAKTEAHYQNVLNPIEAELMQLEQQAAECRDAHRDLIDSAPKYLRDQERALSQEYQAVSDDLNQLRRYAEACRERERYHTNPTQRPKAWQYEDVRAPLGLPAMHDLIKGGDQADAARHYQQAAKRAEEKIRDLEPRKRDLEAQLQTIQAKRLEP
jgi:hypothetical protein